MKQVIIACFAHPDDEAFGTSGMLYKSAQGSVDVHLVLVTGAMLELTETGIRI